MKKVTSIRLALLLIAIFSSASLIAYQVNDEARDFKLKNIDGKFVSLADYDKAKGFIVIFTCNHCPFSVAYEDRIIKLQDKYASKGFPVIAINPNDVKKVPGDSFENMVLRAKEKKFNFPYLRDESQEIAKSFGATRTPHVFVLNKQNEKLIVRYIGAIDNNTEEEENVSIRYVEDAVDALLENKTVPLSQTKAIGCTIKWAE
ncbi:MAG: thioredoxin family protein [Bacteroidetes bacterium]|nr:MAG: thioredoxin family protein [Bacteroidota bacterium]REK06588.1 MAG: thioredoxin family protein [Bacteroidota bacterium]REK33354.1 MAG: thioredoxin family protein [Bacteroidota bacterium]REK49754.1 MAG: thioredoxin family protein [Bacteroidota bacterium]